VRGELTGYWRKFISVFIIKHSSSDQIMENEMGGACSMYTGEEKYRVSRGENEGIKPLGEPKLR
jgi:hypothetical protein